MSSSRRFELINKLFLLGRRKLVRVYYETVASIKSDGQANNNKHDEDVMSALWSFCNSPFHEEINKAEAFLRLRRHKKNLHDEVIDHDVRHRNIHDKSENKKEVNRSRKLLARRQF
jgi:hypothetical protein